MKRVAISPELKAAYLDAWSVVAAYATRDATGPEKERLLREVVERHGGAETAGAIGFLAGSVLLQMISTLKGEPLASLRDDITARLPALLDDMDI